MIFLGTTFCSGKCTLFPPATPQPQILSVQIFDGTYNQLFLSADPALSVNNFDDEWTYDTKMNADFNDNFTAGNSGFSVKTTDHVVIRRRELGTVDWTTIYVKEINTSADFNIHIRDTYARAGVEYEYCISSFINGIENSYEIVNVYSDFDGYYITDKDCIYGTIYDLDGCNTSRNIAVQTLQLLNSKYVNVVSNSELNYDSGSITGTFIRMDEQCNYNASASLNYRNDFKNRLANKKPLILKIYDGRIWMIKVVGTPTDSVGNHPDIRQISFEWVEIGNINDMEALYHNGLSDVDSRWW